MVQRRRSLRQIPRGRGGARLRTHGLRLRRTKSRRGAFDPLRLQRRQDTHGESRRRIGTGPLRIPFPAKDPRLLPRPAVRIRRRSKVTGLPQGAGVGCEPQPPNKLRSRTTCYSSSSAARAFSAAPQPPKRIISSQRSLSATFSLPLQPYPQEIRHGMA